ncbi:MAG: cytochrome c peroxidase, partial [Planctomycetota bacterium]
ASPPPAPPADPTNAWADDPGAALVGRALFFDARLSDQGDTSCSTCHDPATAFSDGSVHVVSPGEHLRRTPSLMNVAHNRWFGWDGRQDSLWSQALAPLEAAREHASSRLHVVKVLRGDPYLREAFEAVFGPLPALAGLDQAPEHARPVPGDPDHPHQRAWDSLGPQTRADVNAVFARVGKALAAYERQLLSSPAPFDRFARGLAEGNPDDVAALAPEAQLGADLFFGRANCFACHDGPLFTDKEFHDNLLPFIDGGRPDRGRHLGLELVKDDPFNGLGAYSDAPESLEARKLEFLPDRPRQFAEFKTPGLRDLGPGPFMHRAEFATLEDVVRHYATLDGARLDRHGAERILVPLDLTDAERAGLVAFLESLRGPAPDPAQMRPPTPRELLDFARGGS